MLIVLTTMPDTATAETLAEKIVEAKLAACVQILPEMRSVYFWQGMIHNEAEHLLLIKTLSENYPALEAFIKSNHPYEVPEITAISVDKTAETYFAWMNEYLQR